MTKILNSKQIWVSYNGLTVVYTIGWWLPFKKTIIKVAAFLVENMDLIYIYNDKTGATGDVKQRVWSKEKGVEL